VTSDPHPAPAPEPEVHAGPPPAPPRRPPGRGRVWLALGIAVAADALQLVFMPLFVEGAAAPWADALDVGVALAMVGLLGWHLAFLPSFAAKLIPGVDLVPTWTAAVLFVSGGRLLKS